MADEFTMKSTSSQSAVLEDRIIGETSTTRLVLHPEIVNNPKNAEAGVKVTLVHQRKNRDDIWEEAFSLPLTALKAGEAAKFSLDTARTLKLYKELQNLYAISSSGGV